MEDLFLKEMQEGRKEFPLRLAQGSRGNDRKTRGRRGRKIGLRRRWLLKTGQPLFGTVEDRRGIRGGGCGDHSGLGSKYGTGEQEGERGGGEMV